MSASSKTAPTPAQLDCLARIKDHPVDRLQNLLIGKQLIAAKLATTDGKRLAITPAGLAALRRAGR